ncbi:MAG: TetR/AcrR family transcriptional regulator [Chitinophagales bacterium]|nr:TetR/AcrR family transcriptional regulator [Chitinophagales bacterium]
MATDKREQLLTAAEELFGEKGFEGTSTRMLAQKAHMNVAMVSYYFGSKEKMFEELVRRKTEKTGIVIDRAEEEMKNPVEKMEVIIDVFVENIMTYRRFHRIMWRELTLDQRPELNEKIGELLFQNKRKIYKIIEQGIKSGYFRKVDIDLSITSIFGTINSLLISEKLTLRMSGKKNVNQLYPSLLVRLKAYLKDWLYVYLSVKRKVR